MFFSKKLKNLNLTVGELDDNEVYLCVAKDKKGRVVKEQQIKITGRELKALAEMQGQKNGLLKYSKETFYEVVGTKEKAT